MTTPDQATTNGAGMSPHAGHGVHGSAHGHSQEGIVKLAIGAIGVVFGDIGTSPLYAFRETFAGHHVLTLDNAHFAVAELVGHGMNAAELAANPRLTRWFVQDLNRNPVLPLDDGAFAGAMCCVSVQYLQRPVEVFAEVRRVLQPGAPFVVSFSNRCFPTKAVAVWRALDLNGHAALVHLYMERAGFSSVEVRALSNGSHCDPLVAVVGR